MQITETKERASNKIFAIFSGLLRACEDENRYWSVDKETARRSELSLKKDLEVYSYILGLIEKDRL